MIGFSTKAKDAMLESLAGQPLEVGLFVGDEEIADTFYKRQPIEFGEPEDDAGVRYIANTNELLFEDVTRDYTIDHWGVFDAGGELLAMIRLVEMRDFKADDRPRFKPGKLSIGIP